MPSKKKNHFVSQGIIKFWANSDEKVVYIYKKNGNIEIEERNSRSVHQRDYLYATWDISGKRDMHAEDALGNEIDNIAPANIKTLIDKFPQILPLSDDQRGFFARFMLLTFIRNPVVLAHAAQLPGARFVNWLFRFQRWFERIGGDDAAYMKIGKAKVLSGMLHSELVTSDFESNIAELKGKRFVFAVPEKGSPNFLLGSKPYFQNPQKEGPYFGVVLHPRLILCVFDDNLEDEVLTISKEDVCEFNRRIIEYSNSIIAAHENDILSALKGVDDSKKF